MTTFFFTFAQPASAGGLWVGLWLLLMSSAQAQNKPLKLPNGMLQTSTFNRPTTGANAPVRPGDPVLILAPDGKNWSKGTLLAVSGSTYKVHYFGKPDSYDEDVDTNRIRRPRRYQTGETVKAEDEYGQWYNATIRGQDGTNYRVRYEGRTDDEPKAVDQTHLMPRSLN